MKNKASSHLALTSLFVVLAFASAAASAAPVLAPFDGVPSRVHQLPAHSVGRLTTEGAYQWPGLYFEAKFKGSRVYFVTGPGDALLQVRVDGKLLGTLMKPAPGVYEIAGLADEPHMVRIDAVSENQAGKNVFRGFSLPVSEKPLKAAPRKRQIEFIGDSHTVGYGNTSTSRDCTQDQVWSTTDNLQAYGAKVAAHYDADYQVNAISGRGIVRNYGGFIADPLPVAYPFVLFDHTTRYVDAGWQPEIIIIALGTNDFSTPLKGEEKWKSRGELHADYEATYVKFVESLRARNPRAFILLWATDMAEHEIEQEAGKVAALLKAKGDARIGFVSVEGLAMTGCHWHPSVADHDAIAAKLIHFIDEQHLD